MNRRSCRRHVLRISAGHMQAGGSVLRRLAAVAMAGCAISAAAAVVSPTGVRAGFVGDACPIFESVGSGANTLPLDWPPAAAKAVVTTVLNGVATNIAEIADSSASTIEIDVPAISSDEARVEVTVAYCDANGIARKTDRAVVYAVTGMNGCAGRFCSAATDSIEWAHRDAKAPVVSALAADDVVTRDGVAVDGGFYRLFGEAKAGVPVAARLAAADGSYAYAVDIVRDAKGLLMIFR